MAALGACVLALAAAGCGSDGSSGSNAAATVRNVESGPTQASLHPIGNSGVSGKVVYVEQPSGMPLMKIRLQGVHKATGETQYFIWQMGSRDHMTSFASYHVLHGSRLSVNLEPSPESLAWLKDGSKTQMLITWVENDDRYFASQEHSTDAEDPTEIGVPVARGTFTGQLVGPRGG
jgi:hypothetical protein